MTPVEALQKRLCAGLERSSRGGKADEALRRKATRLFMGVVTVSVIVLLDYLQAKLFSTR
jgi:hypothetical protein